MKTLQDLDELIRQRESELAPGSATVLLRIFMKELLDRVFINGDETKAYDAYKNAYDLMEKYEKEGTEYTLNDLFN